MTIYKKRHASPLKWILAIIIFVLGMTLTMNDAYGFSFPNCGGSNYGSGGYNYGGWGYNNYWHDGSNCTWYNYDHYSGNNDGCYGGGGENTQPPCAVPEPSTILLLSGGLGAIFIARRKRTK